MRAMRRCTSTTFTFEGQQFTFFCYSEGEEMFRTLRSKGSFYETDLLDAIRARQKIGVYVDVGANIGNHTVFFSALCPSSRVIAVEPVKENYELLLKNIEVNHLRNLVAVNVAAAAEAGFMDMEVDASNMGASRRTAKISCRPVEQKPLDIILREQPPVAVIKIDVEDMECEVLLGALETLKKDHPLVTTECRNEFFRKKVEAILMGLGYYCAGVYCYTPTYLWVWEGSTPNDQARHQVSDQQTPGY
jgi:FkbM family methyltransferase